MSRIPRPTEPNMAVAAVQMIGTLVSTAMTSWPTLLRFLVACVAISLPTASTFALYLLIR
ncbi:hypothetical protein [Actinomadura sp. NTSP31]|uniref:hypothetical protein n=1 Tax=Actinomadura sp. NTSP31 TaxID=1735447 RepID=UPI0035BF0885